MYSKKTENETVKIAVWPRDTTKFLWLDGSCQVRSRTVLFRLQRAHSALEQRSMMEVTLPHDPVPSLAVSSNTSVVVNASASDPIRLQRLSITTVQSSILCSNVEIQGDGLLLQSTSGDITVDGLTIDVSDALTAESPATVYSALGLVNLQNIVLFRCDLHVETGASSLTLSDIHR
jgi:hypothetical protein